MIGAQVCCIFGINVFEVFPKDKVSLPDFTNVAGRFAGNSAEHAPVFLVALWMGTMFVDASSAGVLGCCYVLQRLAYPWMYMVLGMFTTKFEYCTQMGYGWIGQMLTQLLRQQRKLLLLLACLREVERNTCRGLATLWLRHLILLA